MLEIIEILGKVTECIFSGNCIEFIVAYSNTVSDVYNTTVEGVQIDPNGENE